LWHPDLGSATSLPSDGPPAGGLTVNRRPPVVLRGPGPGDLLSRVEEQLDGLAGPLEHLAARPDNVDPLRQGVPGDVAPRLTEVGFLLDPQQLPPIVQAEGRNAARWFGRNVYDWFGITVGGGAAPSRLSLLRTQYRMTHHAGRGTATLRPSDMSQEKPRNNLAHLV